MVDILLHQQLLIAEIFSCPEACLDLFENRDDGGFLLSSIGVIANVDFNDLDKKLSIDFEAEMGKLEAQ